MKMHQKTVLTLEDALNLADFALSTARDSGYSPVAVTVVDANGDLLVTLRDDGAGPDTARVSYLKARTAARRDADTDGLTDPEQWSVADLIGLMAIGEDYIPWRGGVVLHDADGQVVGGIGVSGATSAQDHFVADAAGRGMNLRMRMPEPTP